MSDIPHDLKYTASHEWVRVEDDETVTVGITDHAQRLLGDLVYVELPEVDSSLVAQTASAVVESVKAASDIYSPLTGTVIAVNKALVDDPSIINTDPYGKGWLFKLQVGETKKLDALMNADVYAEQIATEEE